MKNVKKGMLLNGCGKLCSSGFAFFVCLGGLFVLEFFKASTAWVIFFFLIILQSIN